MSNLESYIQNSSKIDLNENVIFSDISVYIKDPLPDNVNINNVLRTVEQFIPPYLTYGIDFVYIGQFDDLIEREVNSLYKDGTIYTTNDQADEEDMIDDFVHEIAHSVEEQFGQDLYTDGKLEVEFLKKRTQTFAILKAYEFVDNSALNTFMNVEFNQDFDNLLYKRVGYQQLEVLTPGLFISPYAITSLREYFANGFENYYLNKNLSDNDFYKISPELFRKVSSLNNLEDKI